MLEEDERPEAPELLPEYSWLWRAWQRLDGERLWVGGGMGQPSPRGIPWRAVRAWADEHRLTVEEFDMLDAMAAELDGALRAHVAAKAEAEAHAQKSRPGG